MIKLKDMDEQALHNLLSAPLCQETTKEVYIYLRELLDLMPVDEMMGEYYLIWSAFEQLYEIYSIRRDIPSINKGVILSIVESNLYGELKENRVSCLQEVLRRRYAIELDAFNEQALGEAFSVFKGAVENILEQSVSLQMTLEDSIASIPGFLTAYSYSFNIELSQIIALFANNDSSVVGQTYYGWKDFFWRHKIRNNLNISKLLRLAAAHHDNKVYLTKKETAPLTSLGQLLNMEEEYISSDTPLGSWMVPVLDDLVRLVPHDVTVIAGERGLGKTTLGAFLAGNLMAQGKKVMFYCPEIMSHKLFFNFILLSYIKAKYNFVVTVEQCLGREAPYPYGSDLTSDEKTEIIKLAKMELSESGLFYHIDKHFQIKTLADEFRSKMISFEPDVVVFDHTLEVKGDGDYNSVTSQLADVFEEIKKEFPVHIIALSHTGSEFKIPTKSNPIVTAKIVAWSRRMEGVADNIIGAFRSEGDCINIFFTKLRWAALIPMYLVFRMERTHSWFNFRPEDQFGPEVSREQLTALSNPEEDSIFYVDDEYEGEDVYDPLRDDNE